MIGDDCDDCAAVVAFERSHGDAADDADPERLGFGRKALHRKAVVGVATRLLVEHGGNTLGAPIGKQALHVAFAVSGTFNKNGFVANRLLLGMDGCHVLVHRLAADLHVAHRVITVGLSVALPNIHRVRHQLAHGRLKVVVANHATGDTRCAGADTRFLQNNDVPTGASASRFKLYSEVVSGAEPMNSGTNNHIGAAGGRIHQVNSPM